MTRQDVIGKEGRLPVYESTDSLMYEDTIIGSPCGVWYQFDSAGRLRSGVYAFDHTNDIVDVNDFFELAESLDAKYGEPTYKGFQWRDPYRARQLESTADLAKAVGVGEVEARRTWRTSDTLIRLVLAEDTNRYNALLWVFYDDVTTVDEERDQRRGRDLDML